MRDEGERVDRPKQIPCRERKRIVVVRRRARSSSHEVASAPGDKPGYRGGIGVALERVGELTRELLAFADACEIETVALFKSLPPDGVDVCAADDDRNISAIMLDPPRDLDGPWVLDRHARDPHEVRVV